MANTINTICITCARFGRDCKGTTCQVWTGCVYYQEDKAKRIFEYYKARLIHESRNNPDGIRFNCIQYLCQFPGIDPAEMAASLQHDGFTILYDDTSISKRENAAHRRQVERAAASLA